MDAKVYQCSLGVTEVCTVRKYLEELDSGNLLHRQEEIKEFFWVGLARCCISNCISVKMVIQEELVDDEDVRIDVEVSARW